MLKQSIQQKLSQRLAPQQIQLMNMLTLPTAAFEEYVKDELEVNPALSDENSSSDDSESETDGREEEFAEDEPFGPDQTEEGQDNEDYRDDAFDLDKYISDDEIPEYRLHTNNYPDQRDDYSVPYSGGKTLGEYLSEQLGTLDLSDTEQQIGKYIIGNIDQDGYLRRPLESIVDDLAFSANVYVSSDQVEKVLEQIQGFDPSGVAARDLRECLLLQLRDSAEGVSREIAREILEEHFDVFVRKNYDRLSEQLAYPRQQVARAIGLIESLNPKPGGAHALENDFSQQIIPDFTIQLSEGRPAVTLNGRNVPELYLSGEYNDLLKSFQQSKSPSKSQAEAVQFVRQRLDAARWFIDAVRQRRNTLLAVINAVVSRQREFVLSGDWADLKPMGLKDIAEDISMDISTVSRAVSGKFVTTPYGTFPLKDFFSTGVTTADGEDVTSRRIKEYLAEVIGREDRKNPLTDQQLMEILSRNGFRVARRTVAKYREAMDIPVARLRRSL